MAHYYPYVPFPCSCVLKEGSYGLHSLSFFLSLSLFSFFTLLHGTEASGDARQVIIKMYMVCVSVWMDKVVCGVWCGYPSVIDLCSLSLVVCGKCVCVCVCVFFFFFFSYSERN